MEEFVAYAQKNLLPLMPLVFALVMVSQGILGLLSLLFNRAKVKIYSAGLIEIGLSQFGSTIALFGTLQALSKDSFITQIKLVVSDSAQQFTRTFEWRALKPYTFSLLPMEEIKLELVSAFLLSTKAPVKHNVVFVDDELLKQYAEEIIKINQLWHVNEQQDMQTFWQTEPVQTLLARLRKDFYWQAGRYNLKVEIYTPNKVHNQQFQFELTEQQVAVLKGNVVKIVEFICGHPSKFDYVNCSYLN
jgi:CRISPR/Cas system CMR subunit Cmr4 (Cas7 group RAMP superfamily)